MAFAFSSVLYPVQEHSKIPSMKEWAFRVTVLALLGFIAFAIYLHGQNGRYQYVRAEEGHGIVIDTRTGEYWTDTMVHIDSRGRRVEQLHPAVTEMK